MVWRGVLPVVEPAVRAELSLWRPLSSGLPDRYRTPFVAVFLVVTFGGLAVLAYKIRTTDPESADERELTSQLERTDLLEGDDPANTLERIIQVANHPTTYVVIFTLLAGLVLAAFVAGGALESAVLALLYLGALLLLQSFLQFGWPYIERFHEGRQSEERDPESLRFQGFSKDMLVFLTLITVMIAGMLGLVALQMVFG